MSSGKSDFNHGDFPHYLKKKKTKKQLIAFKFIVTTF